MPSSVPASGFSRQPRRWQGAELHIRADRWLASARRGRSTWRSALSTIIFPCESRNPRPPSSRKVKSGCCQAARGFGPWAELHRNQQGLGTALPLAECWRLVQRLAASLAAGAFALVALFGRAAPGVGATRAALRFLPNLTPRGCALALTAGAAWMLFNVGFIVMVGFGPGLLQARGASLGQAGFLVSLAIWVSLISVPLGGVVVDRTRRPDLAIVLGCLLTAFAIVAIPLLGVPVVWLLLSGVVVGLAPGALVALVPGSVPPAQLAAALGLFYAAFYLGMAAMQPLAGLLRDVTGSPAVPLFFAAATMVLTVVALGAFRWIQQYLPHLY